MQYCTFDLWHYNSYLREIVGNATYQETGDTLFFRKQFRLGNLMCTTLSNFDRIFHTFIPSYHTLIMNTIVGYEEKVEVGNEY